MPSQLGLTGTFSFRENALGFQVFYSQDPSLIEAEFLILTELSRCCDEVTYRGLAIQPTGPIDVLIKLREKDPDQELCKPIRDQSPNLQQDLLWAINGEFVIVIREWVIGTPIDQYKKNKTALLLPFLESVVRLHREGRASGDIKPSNLVFNKKKGVICHIDLPIYNDRCSAQFASPEQLDGVFYGPRSDMPAVARMIGWFYDGKVPKRFLNIIRRCNSESRPSALEILSEVKKSKLRRYQLLLVSIFSISIMSALLGSNISKSVELENLEEAFIGSIKAAPYLKFDRKIEIGEKLKMQMESGQVIDGRLTRIGRTFIQIDDEVIRLPNLKVFGEVINPDGNYVIFHPKPPVYSVGAFWVSKPEDVTPNYISWLGGTSRGYVEGANIRKDAAEFGVYLPETVESINLPEGFQLPDLLKLLEEP